MDANNITEEQILQRRLAVKKYHAKLANLVLRVSPEEKVQIQGHAEAMGESAAAFLRRAVKETMERDKTE